ncbi:amidohydrolase family protein [Bacteroidota bacterium]
MKLPKFSEFTLRIRVIIFLLASITLLLSCQNEKNIQFDILIMNGKIIDGSGSPAIKADIGIKAEKILKIGNLKGYKADTIIDAANLIVTPGFIDIHTHCDWGIDQKETRANLNYLIQGVTSVATGNCGYGTYEITKFQEKLDNSGIGTNVIPLTGLGLIRNKVMGMENRNPEPQEILEMKELLKQAMEEGSWGLTTGLQYVPGKYASTEEITEISKVAVPYDGIYSTHMRSEEEDLIEAVNEAIEIGKESGINVNISHLKANGKSNWPFMKKVIEIVNKAREDGMTVTADMYPYDKSATTALYSVLLYPKDYNGIEEIQKVLSNPIERKAIKDLTESGIPGQVNWVAKGGWNFFSIIKVPGHPELTNKMFCDLAKESGKSEFDVAADLIIEAGEDVIISLSTMNEENLVLQLQQPWIMVSSDGSAINFGAKGVHPRNYGSNARVLRKYVKEENILAMEEAVRRMSGLAAETMGLNDRGLLKQGYFADIAIFDYSKIYDRATFLDPNHYSEGVEYVIVNGKISIKNGEFIDQYNGKVLLKNEQK